MVMTIRKNMMVLTSLLKMRRMILLDFFMELKIGGSDFLQINLYVPELDDDGQ